jgi:hypothetical protein
MTKKIVAVVLLLCFAAVSAVADGHGKKHRERDEHDRKGREDAAPATTTPLYIQACGECHFAYPPALLNARSWSALMDQTGDHFGEDLGLDNAQAADLTQYLTTNAAENSPGEIARDIARDLGNSVVQRITEIPEIRHEHRKIDETVFARPSVGGFGNCAACHPRADQGCFNDDDVAIPGQ